jgi:outer membrane protein assembly factor BamD (BamD/ComL family)
MNVESSPARSEEAELVLGAARALFREHDARAAIRQLEAYRVRFPSGDLTEEALALAIMAHTAVNDRTAVSLAKDYLRRFPGGVFRREAERAQQRFKGRR